MRRGASTTLTYFVIQPSVVTRRTLSSSELSLFLPLPRLFIVLDEIAIVIAIILFLLLLLCSFDSRGGRWTAMRIGGKEIRDTNKGTGGKIGEWN